MDGKLNRPRRI